MIVPSVSVRTALGSPTQLLSLVILLKVWFSGLTATLAWMLKSKTGARLCFTILGTSEQFNRLSLELLVKSDHITPILRSLHWPPVKYPIDFKIIILTFKILHGHAPDYLCSMIKRQVNSRCLRSSSKVLLFVP